MDEFLEKLREDQRRLRKFLQAQGLRFKRMGEALAVARERSARIFVAAEEPLSGLARVIAEEYLAQLPALPFDLGAPAQPLEGSSEDVEPKFADGQGPPPKASRLARHFRSGDVLLVFAHRGEDATTKALLGFAKMRGVYAILIGGLDAKTTLRRAADASLILPTRGVKTVCEGSFVCARILARCARASLKAKQQDDEGRLLRVTCTSCKEDVFVEERYRGKRGQCPLCRAPLKIPEAAEQEADVAPAGRESTDGVPTKKKKSSRRAKESASVDPDLPAKPGRGEKPILKPSVLDMEAPDLAELEAEEAAASRLDPPAKAGGGAPAAATKRDDDDYEDADFDPLDDRETGPPPAAVVASAASRANDEDERPPVGLSQESARLLETDPSDVVIAPKDVMFEDVAFDELKTATESADPFGLQDGFVQDLVMPPAAAPTGEASSQGGDGAPSAVGADAGASGRLVSARFTAADCRLRFGRGGFPDVDSPEHALESLTTGRLVFRLNAEDEAAGTLDKGDEIWIRLQVPAFLEPVLVRGAVVRIGGASGGSRAGPRVELELREIDPATARKLARAAESLVTA